MRRKKRADRRPLFQPNKHWCCQCCREVEQLHGYLRRARPGRQKRAAVAIFLRYAMVEGGLYGGVWPENLFD